MKKKVRWIKNSLGSGKFKPIIYFSIFYFIFLFLNFIFGDKGYFRMKELQEKKNSLINEIKTIEKENEELDKELVEAKESIFWIEKLAREQLDLVKKNEIVFKIIKKQSRK